ncbi:hypothetical protein RJ639_018081 [Escallonia herrerae]|uniref:Amino acid transporter transmembrane domain-containing protein n=1 Tax=Escallonia herrerae TaxID=1293975 RepID=A0AA88VA69_9ASTE|nr:hypothetical protein RJ639_018081 [Escallonia herrerae]
MYTVHPVRAELGKPSDMNSAVRISLLLSVTIYFAVGFTGYLLFGDSIMPDMPANFDQNSDSPIVIYMVAIAIPNIWFFFQFVGSTTVTWLAFVFPGAIVLRDIHGISTRRDRIMAVLVIILAIVTSSIAISITVCSSVLQKSEITT